MGLPDFYWAPENIYSSISKVIGNQYVTKGILSSMENICEKLFSFSCLKSDDFRFQSGLDRKKGK